MEQFAEIGCCWGQAVARARVSENKVCVILFKCVLPEKQFAEIVRFLFCFPGRTITSRMTPEMWPQLTFLLASNSWIKTF